jgi:hypothetical protein
LAKAVGRCISHPVTGLANLTMSQKISKFDLLAECQKVWNYTQVQIHPDEVQSSDKSLVSHRTDLPFQLPPSYPVMLKEMRGFMTQHRDWYAHYPH